MMNTLSPLILKETGEAAELFPQLRPREPLTLRRIMQGLTSTQWWFGLPPECVKRTVPDHPLVTVLIPAYNEEEYIAGAIQSALQQPHLYQIIVINDGSTDGTGQIADAFAKQHPDKVTVLHQPKASGNKAGAMNAALSLIRSPFFAIVDADSSLEPTTFARMLPHFYDPYIAGVGAQVVAGAPRDGNYSDAYYAKRGENTIAHFLVKRAQSNKRIILVSPGCCTIFRTEILKEVKSFKEVSAEDMEFCLRVSRLYDLSYEPTAVVFSAEPWKWGVFLKQRVRWIFGFLQCYRLHMLEGDMWRKNFKLWLMAQYMFISGLVGLPLMILLMINATHAVLPWAFQIIFGVTPDAITLWLLAILSPMVLNLLVLTGTLILGRIMFAQQQGCNVEVRKTLRCIIPTFIGSFLVQGVFWYSVWKVFFTAEQDLAWDKGH